MQKGLYRKVHGIGPGGMSCPCCMPAGRGKTKSKKMSKIFLNKLVRRTLKLDLED